MPIRALRSIYPFNIGLFDIYRHPIYRNINSNACRVLKRHDAADGIDEHFVIKCIENSQHGFGAGTMAHTDFL